MKIINSRLKVVETANLYERYTGKRHGYRYKAEYVQNKQEDIIHKIVITCTEISEKAPETNVEVRVNCGPDGLFEVRHFITKDRVKSSELSHIAFARQLAIEMYQLI